MGEAKKLKIVYNKSSYDDPGQKSIIRRAETDKKCWQLVVVRSQKYICVVFMTFF